MTDLRTTWHELPTRITHGVTVFGIVETAGGMTGAKEIRTDCGVELTNVDMRDEGPVTCALCLDADWLGSLLEDFETAAPTSVPDSTPSVAIRS